MLFMGEELIILSVHMLNHFLTHILGMISLFGKWVIIFIEKFHIFSCFKLIFVPNVFFSQMKCNNLLIDTNNFSFTFY